MWFYFYSVLSKNVNTPGIHTIDMNNYREAFLN